MPEKLGLIFSWERFVARNERAPPAPFMRSRRDAALHPALSTTDVRSSEVLPQTLNKDDQENGWNSKITLAFNYATATTHGKLGTSMNSNPTVGLPS